MRITRDLLSNIAEDTVAERAKQDASIIAAYLHGSVLTSEDPLLGGTADIDLVFIHDEYDRQREIIRLTEDVHLDIEHHAKADYQPPRELRTCPWRGNTIFYCKSLFDPEHFIDFTQASVRGLFNQYENVLARSRALLQDARATWLYFHNRSVPDSPDQVMAYLQALDDAANALACLNGAPACGRRFLLSLRPRLELLGEPALYDDLLGLLGGEVLDAETIAAWLPGWETDFERLNQGYDPPPALHKHRKAYYLRAFQALLESEQPETAAWPLLHTWTLMAQTMPSQVDAWQAAVTPLGWMGPAFAARLNGLDAYLDRVDLLLEQWEMDVEG